MSANNSSSFCTASKPPPLLWAEFATRLQRFISLPAEEKLSGVSTLANELSPFVHWAVFDLARRHALLIHEPDAHRMLFSYVISLKRTPANLELFLLSLQSVALKQVTAERTALASSLTCAQPAWTGFRNRFNNLKRADRADLLATLPHTSQTAASAQTRSLPDSRSIKLWHEVASGVPQNALPVEWQRFACEHAPSEVQRIEDLLKPPAASSLALPNIILSRESSAKTVKKLGRWLFQAAAVQEQRLGDSSVVELFLPDWAIPKSMVGFGRELKEIIAGNGGLPADSNLHELLAQSSACLDSGLWLPEQMGADKIFRAIHDLGAMGVVETGVYSGHLLRQRDSAGCYLALERQLRLARTPSDVAMTLANLAGFHIGKNKYDDAEALLREALRLNPWSKNARRLVEYLRSAQENPPSQRSHG